MGWGIKGSQRRLRDVGGPRSGGTPTKGRRPKGVASAGTGARRAPWRRKARPSARRESRGVRALPTLWLHQPEGPVSQAVAPVLVPSTVPGARSSVDIPSWLGVTAGGAAGVWSVAEAFQSSPARARVAPHRRGAREPPDGGRLAVKAQGRAGDGRGPEGGRGTRLRGGGPARAT